MSARVRISVMIFLYAVLLIVLSWLVFYLSIHTMIWVILSLVLIISFDAGVYLAIKQGDNFSPETTSEEAEDYGGVVSESKGPVTSFLYANIIILIIWALIYLFITRAAFSNLFY